GPRERGRKGAPRRRQARGGGGARVGRPGPGRRPSRQPGIQEAPRPRAHQAGDSASPGPIESRGCRAACGPAASYSLSPVTAPTTIEDVERRLRERRYIGDRSLATSIFLALQLQKPLFIEGEAGVGKTEAAKVMADVLGARLIRLQCYEGIDLAHAVYEWNYPRQLLHIRLMGEGTNKTDRRVAEREIFSSEFLLRRPLLDAIDNDDA